LNDLVTQAVSFFEEHPEPIERPAEENREE
jgi:hypothetical protein